MNILKTMLTASLLLVFFGCGKKSDAFVHFKIKFDPLQERLNNTGLAASVASGRAAQTPAMNAIGVHSLEISPSATTASGLGSILLNTVESNSNGEKAIDISQVKMVKEGEIVLSIPISDMTPGKYEWIRAGVAYQNFDIQFNLMNAPAAGSFLDERGTMATYLGYNNYVAKQKISTKEEAINDNLKQGFWFFESKLQTAYAAYNKIYSGQANALTFVNPIAQTSPNPTGTCVVTGRFETPLSITGKEQQDINVTLSFSINKSFEWEDLNRNGKWDIDMQSRNGAILIESIKDIGLRGLKATF
jgi:hypothetical protein